MSDHLDGAVLLGHTRLAINDLSPAGAQPVASEDGQVVLVFNGEIYNYAGLRRRCEAAGHVMRSNMDGEVIVHLWEMEGAAALAQLNGIFALALADRCTGEVILARDPIGVKPLFYVAHDRELWFASELQALAASGAPMGTDDVVGLAQFLTFLWIPDPNTPFTGARSLLPGQLLRWTAKGGAEEPIAYAEPLVPTVDPQPLAPAQAVEELAVRFTKAARRQLLSDVPIGLMASGGIDSGLLWAETHDALAAAFTVGWSEADEHKEDLASDAAGVGELAGRFETPVRSIDGEDVGLGGLPHSGDLFADPAFDLTRAIASAAREAGIPVLLSGQGGDELFAGYRRHLVGRLLPFARLGPLGTAGSRMVAQAGRHTVTAEYAARLLRACGTRTAFEAYMTLSSYSTAEERAAVLGCTEKEVADEVVWARHHEVFESLPAGLSFLRKAMTVDLRVYLPGLGLAYVDRASMEFGVEVRVPWLDLDLVRWTLSLPDSCLIRGRQGKHLPRHVARIRLGKDYASRPKRGFGAPARRLPQADKKNVGFRQARYLALAQAVVEQHLERGTTDRP